MLQEGDFKLVVYNYTEGTAEGTANAQWSCSPGCDETRLGNTQCDVACNTSACIWDQGDCGTPHRAPTPDEQTRAPTPTGLQPRQGSNPGRAD